MEKKILSVAVVLASLVLLPGSASAEEASTAVPLTSTAATQVQECNTDSSFSDASPAEAAALSDFAPLEEAIPAQNGAACCRARQRVCQLGCVCGVFEFSCDPSTCQASCICKLCPV